MKTDNKKYYMIAFALLFLAVLFGAFGAHGLASRLTKKLMKTYQTGITYQFYHSIAIVLVLLIKEQFSKIDVRFTLNFFIVGIILFSFNCYLYALTSIKTFAMIVPFGGICFLIGWLILFINFSKGSK